MREFAQVMPTFWTGETGKAIKGKPELQVLAFYLITNPHANALGLYYLPIPFITHETGLTEKKVREGFRKLGDFCKYDAASEFVWVTEMASFQLGNMSATDNRMKGLLRAWQGLPANPFTADFWTKYGEKYGFERRASKGLSKGLEGLPSDTETETDTEIETDRDTPAPAKAVAVRAPSSAPNAVFVEKFSEAYTAKTGAPFKAVKSDYVIAAQIIRDHGLEACVQKVHILGGLCELRSAWFTKDGWASFTIKKLSHQWNSIIPEAHQESSEEKARRQLEEQRARANAILG